MKNRKLKNYFKIGILLFGVSFLLENCENKNEENIHLDFENSVNLNLKTVSFQDAKNFFNVKIEEVKEERKLYARRGGKSPLELTPNWNSIDHNELYGIDQAQLTLADVEVNRRGDYISKLFFINRNDKMESIIFTIYQEQVEDDGKIIKATMYFNELNGEFIDGYKIEAGKIVKRLVVKKGTNIQKAAFFMFFQQKEDCWNTDTLGDFEGGVLDEVVITTSGGGGGGNSSSNFYIPPVNWYYLGNGNSSGMNYSGGGGGGTSVTSVAGSLYTHASNEKELAEGEDSFEDLIEQQLEENPFLLLEIDCNQIQNWQSLAQHTPPQSVKDKVKDLQENHEALLGDWNIQYLNNAGGTIVNMDYFGVNITTLPNNPSTGQQFTPQQFLNYFRRNINNFVEGTNFSPYCEISAICQQETNLWNSNNPLGAVIKLDIPINDGVVVCAEYTNNYWRFMTMEAPYDNSHPVSGTRQFGIEQNSNGSYNIYVRGVDRFESNLQENTSYAISLGNPFFGADNLWESFQEKTKNFINQNGGTSTKLAPIHNRPDWNTVKDVLEGRKPISALGCN